MATAKSAPKEGYETITIPKGRKDEPKDVFIGINGKNWRIPKGTPCEVPGYVAAEYRRSVAARDYADEVSDQKIAEGNQPH